MLHHEPRRSGIHPPQLRNALAAQASDAMHFQVSLLPALLLVRPFIGSPTNTASADFSLRFSPSPFQVQCEISPGKDTILPRTTAGSTPLLFDHKSFAVKCLLALIGSASYPVLVHRLTVSLHTSSPRSVTLTQLYFASLAVVSSREDFHLQDRAHAGRTLPPRPEETRIPKTGGVKPPSLKFLLPTALLHRSLGRLTGRAPPLRC